MKKFFTLLLLAQVSWCLSQRDSSSHVKFSGYLEAYYSYDFSEPDDHQRPSFFYSFNRHNEFNLNLGYIQVNYDHDGIRGNLALMAGTYAQSNLAAEPPIFQHVLEANVGVKLSKKHELWVDAGIMPSHIGFESATGKVCWNLTRGILAENSPYYESGVKLGYTSTNSKWYMAALLLNGWQHIQRVPGCNTPAGGTQITFTPNDKVVVNWSTFAGNEFPDSVQRWRYFNNFYTEIMFHKKFEMIAGFDIGQQQQKKGSSTYDIWYTPVVIAKFNATEKLNFAARAEYYFDDKGVIISTGTANGFQTYGYSVNMDVHLKKHITGRIEARKLFSKDAIFKEKGSFTNQNFFATTSFAIVF